MKPGTLELCPNALSTVESDYERHAGLARQLTEQHFDGCAVVGRVLEQALDIGPGRAGRSAQVA